MGTVHYIAAARVARNSKAVSSYPWIKYWLQYCRIPAIHSRAMALLAAGQRAPAHALYPNKDGESWYTLTDLYNEDPEAYDVVIDLADLDGVTL